MDKVNFYVDQIDKELARIPALQQIDRQAGHPKAKTYAVVAASGLYLLLIFFNVAGSLLTNLIGFVYPAYASFHAIESSNKEDDTQWLTYWCVFAFFNLLEFFSDILLYWLPFYYLIKVLIIGYLILPQFKGATVLYTNFIRPQLLQYSGKIDSSLNKAKKAVASALDDHKNE